MQTLTSPKSLLYAVFLTASLCIGSISYAAVYPKILKFGYILSPDSQLGAGEKVFAAEIAARTNGRFFVEDYPNAMLGGQVAMVHDVQLGVVDIACITGLQLPLVLPELGIFNIPFLFRDADEAHLILDGPIGEDYLKSFDKIGLSALAWGEDGMRHITNSKHPILTPDDLTGLKLRLPPQAEVVKAGFQALGVEVKDLPYQQLYGALRTSEVDAEENPIATILSAKLYEVQAYLSLTGHIYDPAVILMSNDAFDALSDADKEAFKEAAKVAANESRRVAAEREITGIETLKANGMSVVEVVDKSAFSKSISVLMPRFEREFGPDAIARIKNALARASLTKPAQVSK